MPTTFTATIPPFETPLGPSFYAAARGSTDGSSLMRHILSLPREVRARVIGMWLLTAHPAQWPPETPWRTWLFLGGRGAGKTRAGAEWLTAEAERGRRLALVGPSLHDVREVMIEGPSGLRAVAPCASLRPTYRASRRLLEWSNGAVAYAFSAEDPESLRGPQFHAAWADEFCAWRKPDAVLDNLRLGLRRGCSPRLVVTTTPKPIPALRRLMAQAGVAVTRAATAQKGKDILLKIGDAGSPQAFVTVAGLRARTISLNAKSVDATDGDSAGRWRELLEGAGVRQASVSGSGVFKDAASDAAMRQAFFDQAARDWMLVIPGFGVLTGPFLIAALEYAGQHDAEATFALTLASAGALIFTAGV